LLFFIISSFHQISSQLLTITPSQSALSESSARPISSYNSKNKKNPITRIGLL